MTGTQNSPRTPHRLVAAVASLALAAGLVATVAAPASAATELDPVQVVETVVEPVAQAEAVAPVRAHVVSRAAKVMSVRVSIRARGTRAAGPAQVRFVVLERVTSRAVAVTEGLEDVVASGTALRSGTVVAARNTYAARRAARTAATRIALQRAIAAADQTATELVTTTAYAAARTVKGSPKTSPSPSPTPTSSPSPTPTATASPTPSPTPTASTAPSPTPTGTASPTPIETATASPTPIETATASPTETVTASPTPTLSAPATPEGLGAVASDATVTLSWTASVDATYYVLTRDGAAVATLATPGYVDAGLVNGTAHTYTVAAANAAGSSAASVAVTATPMPPAPAVPAALAAAPGSTVVWLTWTAAVDATSYSVYRNGVQVGSTSATSWTDSGLTNGTAYTYTVASVNMAAISAQSAAVTATPMPPAPATPTGLAASGGNATVALTWTAAANATSYKVFRNGTQVAAPTGTSYTDSGLTNGTSYGYTVAAVNMAATSAQSATATGTPLAPVPSAPTGLAAVPGSTTVALSWAASTYATSYKVFRNGTQVGTATGTSYTDSGLVNGTSYTFTAAAVNGAGTSSQSASVTATPVAPVATFTLGVTRPDASNTGVPAGTALKVYNGDLAITTAGTVIDGYDVYGFVSVQAANVTIKNSRIRGRNVGYTNKGTLVDCSATTCTNLTLDRVTIRPDFPRWWLEGVYGGNYTVNRCDISGTVDGFLVKQGTTTITGNYVHDFYFSDQSTDQANSTPAYWTHNDGIQFRVASGTGPHVVTGNNIAWYPGEGTIFDRNAVLETGYASGPSYYNKSFRSLKTQRLLWGSAITVSPDLGPVVGVDMQRNWFDGGTSVFQMSYINSGATSMNFGTLAYNKFGYDQFDFGNGSYYEIRYKSTATIAGLTTNTWDAVSTVPLSKQGTAFYSGFTGGIRIDA